MSNHHRCSRIVSSINAFLTLTGTKAKQAVAVVTTLLVALSCVAQDQPQTGQEPDPQPLQAQATAPRATVTIPAGTRIALVLTHPIQSRYIHRGDDIYAQITSPVTSGNAVAIPPGAFIDGKVDRLERKGGRGELYLQSMWVTFPNGYVAAVSGPVVLESGDGYALKDPGQGRLVGAFTLPVAGAGLGALIGHSASSSQGTTTTVSLPPSCGVPTPGCTNGTSQTLTNPASQGKSTVIGAAVGGAIGMVTSLLLLASSHNFFLDVGSPVEMVLQQPLSLEQDEVTAAVQQSEEHPAPPQPIVRRAQPSPPPPSTDHGACYTPDTPGTPPTIIPGTPPTGDSPGTPDIVIPGTPSIPGTPYPCP